MARGIGLGWAPLILSLALGLSGSPTMPIWLSGAAERFHFTAQQSGLIGSLELACLALASITWAAVSKANRGSGWLALAIAVSIAGNLMSFYAPSANVLIVARGLVGLSLGVTLSDITRRAAQLPNPHRVFAVQQLGLILFIATFFATVPMAISAIGGAAPFLYNAVLGGLALISTMWLPSAQESTGAENAERAAVAGAAGQASLAIAMTFIAIGLTYLSQSALFTYITDAAKNSGVGLATLGQVLAFGALLNIVASLAAGQIGLKWGKSVPLLVGYALMATSVLLIALGLSPSLFIVGAIGLNFSLMFLTPFLLGSLANLDSSGRSASAGPAFFTIGGAIGPALAGFVIGGQGFAMLGAILAGAIASALVLALFAGARMPVPAR